MAMNRISKTVDKLIRIANMLDESGNFVASDRITQIATRLAQYYPYQPMPYSPYAPSPTAPGMTGAVPMPYDPNGFGNTGSLYPAQVSWNGQGNPYAYTQNPQFAVPQAQYANPYAANQYAFQPVAPTAAATPAAANNNPLATVDTKKYYNTGLNAVNGNQEGSVKRKQYTQAAQMDQIKQMVSVLKRKPTMTQDELTNILVTNATKYGNSGQFIDWIRTYIMNNFQNIKASAGVVSNPAVTPAVATETAKPTLISNPNPTPAPVVPESAPKMGYPSIKFRQSKLPVNLFGDNGMQGYLTVGEYQGKEYLLPESAQRLKARISDLETSGRPRDLGMAQKMTKYLEDHKMPIVQIG